jgi:hypothetical protein
MKAITARVILTGVSTRADRSLALRFVTTELSAEEKLAFLEAADQELVILLQPKGMADGIKEVKGEFDRKTSSQRLRSVLFVKWNQEKQPMSFDDYYKAQMEWFINSIKETLAPAPQGENPY